MQKELSKRVNKQMQNTQTNKSMQALLKVYMNNDHRKMAGIINRWLAEKR